MTRVLTTLHPTADFTRHGVARVCQIVFVGGRDGYQ
jgi:hypothetical protein